MDGVSLKTNFIVLVSCSSLDFEPPLGLDSLQTLAHLGRARLTEPKFVELSVIQGVSVYGHPSLNNIRTRMSDLSFRLRRDFPGDIAYDASGVRHPPFNFPGALERTGIPGAPQ